MRVTDTETTLTPKEATRAIEWWRDYARRTSVRVEKKAMELRKCRVDPLILGDDFLRQNAYRILVHMTCYLRERTR